jgi:hypothetical protein
MKFLSVVCILCGLVFPASALDREAFTFTQYNLNLTIDPGQQRLAARGKVTLRNDSDKPQQNVVLQISSTLHWASIQIGGKPAEYVTQTYNSDIDHTGALTETIVTLPHAVAPKQAIEIEVGYEGVIPQDVTRLTRIGVPADTAKHSDWDQISTASTGVRGIGYVAWYPIATDAANMSDPRSMSETVGRWKRREVSAQMRLTFAISESGATGEQKFFCRDERQSSPLAGTSAKELRCSWDPVGSRIPYFVFSAREVIGEPAARVFYLPEHKSGADDYVLALNQVGPSVSVWLGGHTPPNGTKPMAIDLPDGNAAPFGSGNTLLMPLTGDDTSMLLTAVQQTAQLDFPSPRTWISQGLARYAQVRFIEQEKSREAALTYLQSHRAGLTEAVRGNAGQGGDAAAEHSLINSVDEFYVQIKAMNVWWMLRDLVGETALTAALHNYKPDQDKDAMYMQKLLEAQSHRDLTWFFDDWVYRDRGLPDLRIDSVYSRPIVSGGYMVTVTVENLGGAAAEVPVTLQMVTGDATEKLLVPGKSKASVRITAGSSPMKATVNGDCSVPESDMTNNTYKIESLNH